MIEIVSATRLPESDFWSKAALGLSLKRLARDRRLIPHIAFGNRRGLPEIYNARIMARDGHDFVVFMHDDVWIDDYFLAERVIAALSTLDVVGVAGNRRRVKGQPGWAFVNEKRTWDVKSNLSGRVAHGPRPFGKISYYGVIPAACEMLDGVFLAARRSRLVENGVLFDTRFEFHFYDMDFCRSARQKGLRLGTWPICLTHQSGGKFGKSTWNEMYRLYREKWPD